ncbi:hybrid sensor histidine kinase/response regulator [Phototrophicus methaneseepsis]|uniref:histidine kinase n=1 Tax=Phototrophicus methaneseepsis TaxID=2710758 RepID=A0A7S8ECZ8_9CHLR|nr:hybrid sensor histidine kinase/response regulator [Phototrophicus methaneseepsis]QPC84671.1 hybrid sensor histidine kinase/response regulator [Phototrophicus methaneseepsis]
MTTDQKLLQIFREEVTDYLQVLNDGLLRVEMTQGEERYGLIREMNRVAHSMKGAARAVGYAMIETVGHHMEEVLNRVLAGTLTLTPDVADTLYDGLDLISSALEGADEADDTLSDEVIETVIENLRQAAGIKVEDTQSSNGNHAQHSQEMPIITVDALPPTEPVEVSEPPPIVSSEPLPPENDKTASSTTMTMVLGPGEESLRVAVRKLDRLMAEVSELLVARMQNDERQRQISNLRRDVMKWQRQWRSVRGAYIRMMRREQEPGSHLSSEVVTLIRFMENNERSLSQMARQLAQLDQRVAQDNMQLTALADMLQNDVASLRMMPFEAITGSFHRMVRDIAREQSKEIDLHIEGAKVEIDKTVLDALKDPLVHLLRNAVDHGLEDTHTRAINGKSPTGHLSLKVLQRGSEIVIVISDDGRGFDVARIKKKALQMGLISIAELETLSDVDARMLVFHSGFSTNDQVTAISGRGLGMDIVRTRIEGLRGRIEVESISGESTTITLHVPVSLTRIRGVLLHLGEETYAVPSVMVNRMESLPRTAIYTAEGKEMVVLNEHPMPLVKLGDLLSTPGSAERGDVVNVIVLQLAERMVAFEVDGLYSEMELVLTPLGKELANLYFIAGAALLGSGEVLLVLDANDLVRRATGMMLGAKRAPRGLPHKNVPERLRVLIVDDSITTRTLEKNILEAVGFDVQVAIHGQQAWEMLAESQPDVIISDVEMPYLTGLELARLVKSHPHTRNIPFVLLTSLTKPAQREAGLQAGADAYLVKSRFDQQELLETIQSVL